MQKMILSIYPKKSHPTIESVSLLAKDEKPTVAALRKALYQIDLTGKLVLCMDSELSKLFKEDYGFNDHGIYYDVFFSGNFSLSVHDLEAKVKKLKTKLAKKFSKEVEAELQIAEYDLTDFQCQKAFTLVPLEQQTAKRDYQRFLEYESFVDPVLNYKKRQHLFLINHVILDIETTGLEFENNSITMIGLKALGGSDYRVLENPNATQVRELLLKLEGKTIIGHNLVFDLSWLMYVAGLEYAPNFDTVDTMLLAHVAGERQLSLKHLSMMYGNFKGRRNTMTADESYLVEDLLATELLYEKYKDKLNTFAGKLVCNAVKTFSEVRVNGVVIDKDTLFNVRDSYRVLDEPKYDFNVDSNRELARYLIENNVHLTEKTDRGDYKVDQKTLENFKDNPIVEEYLDYQKEMNIYQKFIKPYCEMQSYTIRPDIKLWGTETGRLSCSNPNVQQIPNRSLFKDIFRSRFGKDGYIASIDLDQAELRIAALLSGDTVYASALLSNDFHRLVASKTFGKPESSVSKQERFVAKSVNFGGVLYGGSAAGIANRIKVEPTVVAKVQEWYKEEFVTLTDWIEDQKELAVRTNQVTTHFGRVRPLETVHDRKMRWDEKRRIGVNTAVQSVASDVMLYIVTRLSGLLRKHQLKSKILFPVHDELLLDIHQQELDTIVSLLQQAFKDVLKTPIGRLELASSLPVSGVLEYGQSWLYVKNEKYQPTGKVKISSLET